MRATKAVKPAHLTPATFRADDRHRTWNDWPLLIPWRQATTDRDALRDITGLFAVEGIHRHWSAAPMLDLFNSIERPPDGTASAAEIRADLDPLVVSAQSAGRSLAPYIVTQIAYGLPLDLQPASFRAHDYVFQSYDLATINRCAETGVLSPERTDHVIGSRAGATLVPWMVAHQRERPINDWHNMISASDAECDICDNLLSFPQGDGYALIPQERLGWMLQATHNKAAMQRMDLILQRHGCTMPANVRARINRYNTLLNIAADCCFDDAPKMHDRSPLPPDPESAASARQVIRALPKFIRDGIRASVSTSAGNARWLQRSTPDLDRRRGGFASVYVALTHDDPAARGIPIAELMTTYVADFGEPWYQRALTTLLADVPAEESTQLAVVIDS